MPEIVLYVVITLHFIHCFLLSKRCIQVKVADIFFKILSWNDLIISPGCVYVCFSGAFGIWTLGYTHPRPGVSVCLPDSSVRSGLVSDHTHVHKYWLLTSCWWHNRNSPQSFTVKTRFILRVYICCRLFAPFIDSLGIRQWQSDSALDLFSVYAVVFSDTTVTCHRHNWENLIIEKYFLSRRKPSCRWQKIETAQKGEDD